jgi:RNA polymerase sigma-70 factor (ECF subfamily)
MFGKKKHIDNDQVLKQAESQLRKGSAEAFRILYDKYNKKVYRFCLRMLGDVELAEDAFQETFIKVYENRQDFRGKNFAAWLFTIARHTSLNMIRARKTHESFDETFHAKKPARVSDVGAKDFIQRAMSMLPVALREALILREYEECSYKEIAVILDIDLSLAKVRVHRARLQLRKLLKPLVKEMYES